MHMGQHSQVPAAITALQKTVVFPTNIRQQKPCVLQKSNPWNSQGQPSSHHQFPGKVRLRLEVSEGQGTRGSGMTGSHSPTSEKAAEANDASVGPRSKGNRSGMLRMLPTVIWAALNSPQLLLKCRLCTETTAGAESSEPKHPAFYTIFRAGNRLKDLVAVTEHWGFSL